MTRTHKGLVVAALALAAGGVMVGHLGAQTPVNAGGVDVLAQLEQTAMRNEMDSVSRFKLGTLLLEQGRVNEARHWLNEANKIDPELYDEVQALLPEIESPAPTEANGRVAGPDVLLSDVQTISNHGQVGAIRAYSIGSHTCNMGSSNLEWVNNGSPGLAMNAYRLKDGRMIQLGLSFVKTACCAAQGNGCGIGCTSGAGLGPGCLDVYTSGWNAGQGRLAARSAINPYTGAFSSFSGASGDAVFKRIQVQNSEVTAPASTGSLYFIEGVYVSSGDAANANWNNNATYKRVNVDGSGNFSLTGSPVAGIPAIRAWRDHGGGVGVVDPSVTVQTVDVPSEGRYWSAAKVIDNGNGTWRYEYAVFNLNSDKAGGSFSVPFPAGVTVTNVGFYAPLYHSGEVYSNTPWNSVVGATSVTWSSPQTFAQNANTNALRWGTMYNFWFTANYPPTSASLTLGLFKPHTTQQVSFTASAPSGPAPCPADLDGDGQVGASDLASLLGSWGAVGGPADLDGGGVGSSDLAVLLGSWGPCA